MPEGDTIHKVAHALATRLDGQQLTAVSIRQRHQPQLAGRTVARVSSHGKHLFIDTTDGIRIGSHLGLYGSWHSYRVGEPWHKPARQASLVLQLADAYLVCFNAKEVVLLARDGFAARDQVARLGPDLTDAATDLGAILERAACFAAPQRLLVDVLLDQRIAAGIGNVYKSELLFLTRLHPSTRRADIDATLLETLYRTAVTLLRRNLAGGPRITRDIPDGRGPLWVYRRAGSPCLRCGTRILRALLGERPRSSYWCPSCQPGSTSDDQVLAAHSNRLR